jgi:hypothetical protein
MGSKSVPLRTLVAASSAKMAGFGVPSSVPKWRAIQNKTTSSYTIEIACDFSILNGSTAVGAEFGLTRCRREFQHASRQRAPFAPGS